MKIYCIGIGPGGEEQMTLRAARTLEKCDCVAGYGLYLDLIENLIEGKERIQTGMTREVDRCAVALDAAKLTPWDNIEQRLRGAAAGDFGIALYNPSSRKRADYLRRACDILLETLSPDTVCGTVRNIGREGESFALMTLGALRDTGVDMLTTVFVGNSRTVVIDGRMVTPRGYRGV